MKRILLHANGDSEITEGAAPPFATEPGGAMLAYKLHSFGANWNGKMLRLDLWVHPTFGEPTANQILAALVGALHNLDPGLGYEVNMAGVPVGLDGT